MLRPLSLMLCVLLAFTTTEPADASPASSSKAVATPPTIGTDSSRRQRSGAARFGARESRSSPFAPPVASDTTFVVDKAAMLDTACTFRGGGPLKFKILNTRYVGETNSNGTLADAAGLVAAGVVSSTAKLSMPVWDVDYNTSDPTADPPLNPERNLVRFNGRLLGDTKGSNDTWTLNTYEIPIQFVRFPNKGLNGAPPIPAENEIVIDIDTANIGQPWCTAADWAALQYKALSPVILIHGNNSNGAFFERRGFAALLRSKRVPYDNSINLESDITLSNGVRLSEKIPAIARSFGVDSVHLVAHSKGGLDAREYLARHTAASADSLKVLSLTTLTTPHDGTVSADFEQHYVSALRAAAEIEYAGLPGVAVFVAQIVPRSDGTPSLTTVAASTFNRNNAGALPREVSLHAVAADADVNLNGSIDSEPDEYAEMRDENAGLRRMPVAVSRRVVTAMYQFLRNTASVELRYETRLSVDGREIQVALISRTPDLAPKPNDILVTVPSALGQSALAARWQKTQVFTGSSGRNHANVANGGVADAVLPWIFEVERREGDLKP